MPPPPAGRPHGETRGPDSGTGAGRTRHLMPLFHGRTERRLDPADAWAGIAPDGSPAAPAAPARRVSDVVAAHLLRTNDEIRRLRPSSSLVKRDGLVDVLLHQ